MLAKDYLPVGAKVIVCGRLRAQQSTVYRDVPFVLRSTADEPVMVLRDDDPEALLATWRLAQRVHSVLTVAVIMLFVLLIGVVIGMLPNLPQLHLPPNSGSSDD